MVHGHPLLRLLQLGSYSVEVNSRHLNEYTSRGLRCSSYSPQKISWQTSFGRQTHGSVSGEVSSYHNYKGICKRGLKEARQLEVESRDT
jgi:SET domain-containing protein